MQRKEVNMSKEVVVRNMESLPVTRDDVEALKQQRELLMDFIQSQLKEGINGDYAQIPGTNKKSLLKPGAEKLARLFQLGVEVESVDKMIDPKTNFAMFTYRARIYPLRNDDVTIAECEGCCNSQEKKYKERAVWVKLPNQTSKVKQNEVTPVFDIMNTLMKMAQKRAVVGAVILAVGASDFFTQDIEDASDAAALGVGGNDKPDPVKASVVPKATAARSTDQGAQPKAPICKCGSPFVKSVGKGVYYCSNWQNKDIEHDRNVPASEVEG
jgi:hypothetical protein